MRRWNADHASVVISIHWTWIRKPDARSELHPLLAQWRVRGKYVVHNLLAQRNPVALPVSEERPGASDEDIRIEIPEIFAIAGFICQQVQHEPRLVIREMDACAQLQEREPKLIRYPELVRMVI